MFRLASSDGTIFGEKGKVLHFSVERFVKDVVQGGCCFMCGRSKSETVPFNDEHVVPDWLLRRYKMQNQQVVIPGGQAIIYGRYKLPCCVDCNSELGRRVEDPVSQMLSGDIDKIESRLQEDDEAAKLLYCWSALLFLKMHLKDLSLRMHLDARKGDMKIGAVYDWSRLQHVQSIARCPLIGADVRRSAIGTFLIREIWSPPQGTYDYGNFSFAYTSMLQLDNMVIFAVFDDAKMCQTVLREDFSGLGLLTHVQARELLARLAYTNMRIEETAKFKTWLNQATGEMYVEADPVAKFNLAGFEADKYGLMYDWATKDVPVDAEVRALIRKGEGSFVYGPDGFVSRVYAGPVQQDTPPKT